MTSRWLRAWSVSSIMHSQQRAGSLLHVEEAQMRSTKDFGWVLQGIFMELNEYFNYIQITNTACISLFEELLLVIIVTISNSYSHWNDQILHHMMVQHSFLVALDLLLDVLSFINDKSGSFFESVRLPLGAVNWVTVSVSIAIFLLSCELAVQKRSLS